MWPVSGSRSDIHHFKYLKLLLLKNGERLYKSLGLLYIMFNNDQYKSGYRIFFDAESSLRCVYIILTFFVCSLVASSGKKAYCKHC